MGINDNEVSPLQVLQKERKKGRDEGGRKKDWK